MTTTQRWTMLAAILGSAIVFLDGTIVNVALPKIGEDLPASLVGVLEGQTYVASGYLATLAALLILAGALGDYYGRRRVFTYGLAGFGVTSLLCGLAPSLELLAVFRVLQGAAGAFLVPGALSIITATFDGPARARAFGIWASATSATTLLGPIVGGILVSAISWRVAFLINAPLILLALYAALRHMEETRDEGASRQFDWLGAFVAALAVGGLAFGAIRGQEREWKDPVAFAALGAGFVAAVALPVLMARRPHPLIPLAIFRSRQFTVINLSTLLIYGALYVQIYFQTLFMQGVLGYSPLASGLLSLPAGITLTLFSARVGTIAGRIGPRVFLVAGPLIMTVAQLLWYRVSSTSPAWQADISKPESLVPPLGVLTDPLPSILLFAVGITLVVAPLTSTLMSSVPVRQAGLGSAINNAVSRVGQPLLSAVIFIVVSGAFYTTLSGRVAGLDTGAPGFRQQVAPLNPPAAGVAADVRVAARDASTDAFHLATLVGAGLMLAGAGVNFVGLRHGSAAEDRRTATAGADDGTAADGKQRDEVSPPG